MFLRNSQIIKIKQIFNTIRQNVVKERMYMTRLIILGNGFDLYHNLPTSYTNHLVPILENNDEELFYKLTRLYFNTDIDLWSDFENLIGSIGSDKDIEFLHNVVQERVWRLNGTDIIPYSIESEHHKMDWMEMENALNEARDNGVDMIETFQESNRELLEDSKFFIANGLAEMCKRSDAVNKKNIGKKDFCFTPKDYFLTFNYTSTLEMLYENIPSTHICHIHGTVKDINSIIYGNTPKKIKKISSDFFEYNENYSKEDVGKFDNDDMNVFVELVTKDDEEFFEYNEKVEELISKLNESMIKQIQIQGINDFLQSIDIKEVFIYGFSMGKVDFPYLIEINNCFPNARWYLSYFDDEDYKRKQERIVELPFGGKIELVSDNEFKEQLCNS